jgi:hypothetical protein
MAGAPPPTPADDAGLFGLALLAEQAFRAALLTAAMTGPGYPGAFARPVLGCGIGEQLG